MWTIYLLEATVEIFPAQKLPFHWIIGEATCLWETPLASDEPPSRRVRVDGREGSRPPQQWKDNWNRMCAHVDVRVLCAASLEKFLTKSPLRPCSHSYMNPSPVQEIRSVYEKSVNQSASLHLSDRGYTDSIHLLARNPTASFCPPSVRGNFLNPKEYICLLDSQWSGAEWLFPTSFLLPHYSNEELSPSAEGPKVHSLHPAQKVTGRVEERSRCMLRKHVPRDLVRLPANTQPHTPFLVCFLKRKTNCSFPIISCYLHISETKQYFGLKSYLHPFIRNFSRLIRHVEKCLHGGGKNYNTVLKKER